MNRTNTKGGFMRFLAGKADIQNINDSSLVLFCVEGNPGRNRVLKEIDRNLGGTIRAVYDSNEFAGQLNQTVVIHTSGRAAFGRLILAGLGPKKALKPDCYRQAAGTMARLGAVRRSSSLGIYFGENESAEYAKAIVEGFILGRYCLDDYKSEKKHDDITDTVTFYSPNKAHVVRLEKGIKSGEIIGGGASLTRTLSAMPGNDLTPRKFVSRAQKLAQKYNFQCKALDEKHIRAERMNAYLGVARGSAEPPRFLILEYRGGRAKAKPIVLIGKGITFDSGGISLKPGLDMQEMKSDMTGGAIVLAAIMTATRLGLKQNIIGLVPLAENLPSGNALKPGDIITSRKGKTIEIINTDAEGRLILIDALDYANEFNPQAVIDICTLTGGAMYILGYWGALLMGNNDRLKDLIRSASEASAENVWELPIWDGQRKWIKSDIADLKNSGGKPATSITAAAFLEACIGDWPWAHIDIASVDIEKYGQPYVPKGHTGFGFRLIMELLSNWKKA